MLNNNNFRSGSLTFLEDDPDAVISVIENPVYSAVEEDYKESFSHLDGDKGEASDVSVAHRFVNITASFTKTSVP